MYSSEIGIFEAIQLCAKTLDNYTEKVDMKYNVCDSLTCRDKITLDGLICY